MMIEIALERAAAVLATDALKSSLILSVAGLTVAVWRGASASSRHLVWTAAVAATISLPAVGLLLPSWRSPELAIRESGSSVMAPANLTAPTDLAPPALLPTPAQPATFAPISRKAAVNASAKEPVRRSAAISSATSSSSEIILPSSSIPPGSTGATLVETSRKVGWSAIVIAVWLIGFVLVLLPFCIGRLRLRRIAATARPVTDGRWIDLLQRMRATGETTRRVTLLESHDAAMPMTWGVISPVLLVPSSTEEWPEWKCRDILLHEVAHIERFDCLTQIVARLACAAYWFNPLAWMAAHRMRVERELACDDRVINNGSRPSEYATHLLDVALSLRPARATAQAAIAMARTSQLSGRLAAVLDRERNRRKASPRFRAAVGAATMGVLLPVASFSPFVTEATAATSAPRLHAPVSVNTRFFDEGTAATTRQSSVSFDSTPAPAAPAPVASPPGFVVATTSGATSSIVTTSSAAGFGFSIATTPIAAPGSVAAVLYAPAQGTSCWESKGDVSNHNHNSVSINNDGSGTSRTTVTFSSGDCTLDIRADGEFTLRPDLTDVARIERGGYFSIEERARGSSRRMEIRPGSGGLEHVYYIDGRRTEYSAEARAWLAQVLLATERHTAFAAATRVPQIFEGRGASGVLDEVSMMQSDYAKAAYLNVLFKQDINFDAPLLTRVVKQSTREMTSDYYLAEVFNLVGAQKFTDESTWRAFADAAGGIKSDYYKAQVIGKVLSRNQLDAGTIATLLKAASTIDSDYYKHQVLNASLGERPLSRETVVEILAIAPSIKSDYELSGLLATVAKNYPIDESLRPAYEKAVDAIESEYYRGAALSAERRSSTSR